MSRFNHVNDKSKLSAKIYDELIEFCKDCRLDTMFGDGMEVDYVLYGCTIIKGLYEMTDDELIEEAECYGGGDLPERARAELAVHEMLVK